MRRRLRGRAADSAAGVPAMQNQATPMAVIARSYRLIRNPAFCSRRQSPWMTHDKPYRAGFRSVISVLYLGLSVRTLRLRRSLQIAVGDAGNKTLLRAMRVHANFAEYVPICLLLLYLAEAGGAATLLVHGLGAALLAGRCAHAWGVSQAKENYRFRIFGMAMTFMVLIA